MATCPRFEIKRTQNLFTRKWRYRVRLIADNCEPLNVSENLTSEAAAMTNIEAVKAIAVRAPIVKDWIRVESPPDE